MGSHECPGHALRHDGPVCLILEVKGVPLAYHDVKTWPKQECGAPSPRHMRGLWLSSKT